MQRPLCVLFVQNASDRTGEWWHALVIPALRFLFLFFSVLPRPPARLPLASYGLLSPVFHFPSSFCSVSSLPFLPPSSPVDHSGVVPFPTPPLPEHGVTGAVAVFPKDHSSLLQGTMAEHFGVLAGPRDLNGPSLSRARESLSLPSHPLEHLGPALGGGGGGNTSSSGLPLGPAHRDAIGRSGMILRSPRPDFRPREAFLGRDPFHSLKRPRPPFVRGPPFFAPKRPFFPPRY